LITDRLFGVFDPQSMATNHSRESTPESHSITEEVPVQMSQLSGARSRASMNEMELGGSAVLLCCLERYVRRAGRNIPNGTETLNTYLYHKPFRCESKQESLSPNSRWVGRSGARSATTAGAPTPSEVQSTSGATNHDARSWFALNGLSVCREWLIWTLLGLLDQRPVYT